jgi:hypothetical protein
LLNCRAAEKNPQQKNTLPEALIKSSLGEKYTVTYNAAKTYALCQQSREGDHLRRKFRYIVVRLSDNAIVNEGSFQMGYVKWHDEASIEVLNSSSVRDDRSAEKKIIKIDQDTL